MQAKAAFVKSNLTWGGREGITMPMGPDAVLIVRFEKTPFFTEIYAPLTTTTFNKSNNTFSIHFRREQIEIERGVTVRVMPVIFTLLL